MAARPRDRRTVRSLAYACRSQPRRRFRPLVVGEAPSRTSDPVRPVSGRCGETLADYAGLTPSAFRRRFVCSNLLDEWPGRAGKGAVFPVVEATMAAVGIKIVHFGRPRVVVLLGKRVARAFRVPSDYFRRTRYLDCSIVVVPHPSGVNRWFNDARNRAKMRRFMREIARAR